MKGGGDRFTWEALALCGLAGMLATCAGCWRPRAPTPIELDRGLIWLFPGVEGGTWSLEPACRAFRDAGVQAAIHIHDWERPFGAYSNLVSYERNRADAVRIAAEIARHHEEHPAAPIDLVGYSGGGGLAVMVAEALPAAVRLRNVVLAQPAISPDYDLTRVLQHVDGKLVNYYSPLDWLILGLGTSAFGTMDRVYTPSAGKGGFVVLRAIPDDALRAHFEQFAWSGAMISAGHYGGHLPIMLYEWNRQFIAPYVKPVAATDRQPDEPPIQDKPAGHGQT